MAVVAFRILPPEVYEVARLGAFNLHGSLLPAYRGAAPIHRAVMDGAAETGVTTFLLQRTVDTGDVLLRRRTPIGPDETTGEVYERLSQIGAEAVVETVRMLEEGEAQPEPQDDRQASAAPKVFPEDGEIDWGQSAQRVHDHIRGLSPSPSAWTYRGDEKLKLYRSRVTEGSGTPGEVLEAGPRLVVAAGEGAVEILEVQRPGKKRMDAAALLNGYDLAPGERFTSHPVPAE
jgi:methionyl-tRNA formyltransferase